MTQTKSTPGPWAFIQSGINCFSILSDGEGQMVGYTFPRVKVEKGHATPVDPTDRDWANARLIAAAPELLQALNDILNQTSDVGVVDIATAAIAKATGAA